MVFLAVSELILINTHEALLTAILVFIQHLLSPTISVTMADFHHLVDKFYATWNSLQTYDLPRFTQ